MMEFEQAKAALGEEFSFFSEIVFEQLQNLELSPGARILDVGTGQGVSAIAAALCGYQVLTGEPAEDNSEYAKQEWRENARKVGVEEAITFQPFDAAALPFDDASFDAVFMLGALHHMDDQAAALRECLRVLCPGGAICILEPTAALVESVRDRFPDHPDPTDPAPLVDASLLQTTHGEQCDAHVVRRPR